MWETLSLNIIKSCIHSLFQRHLVDRAYYIAKELLMTERTYKKDLEVITVVSIKVLAKHKLGSNNTLFYVKIFLILTNLLKFSKHV